MIDKMKCYLCGADMYEVYYGSNIIKYCCMYCEVLAEILFSDTEKDIAYFIRFKNLKKRREAKNNETNVIATT
jgi:hypothetical protein